MMINLFNIFDPSTSSLLSLNWMSSMIILIIFPPSYWLIPSRSQMFFIKIQNIMFTEYNSLITYSKSNSIMFVSVFMFILVNNFWGLIPYIFTSSSHMSFCLSMSLSLWMSMMIYSWVNFHGIMLSHLTPAGTPMILSPFMVLIELISLMIRPVTLSIRLTANMIAGHLLLSLLGSTGTHMTIPMILTMLIPSQIILLTLETAVSMIQAYVFSILSALYSSEI